MVVIFGSDERSLNDVQVSSRHCHCRMTTERERQGHKVNLDNCASELSDLSAHVQTFDIFF